MLSLSWVIGVAAGGASGALTRGLLAELGQGALKPWATLTANLGGCLLLGYLSTAMGRQESLRPWWPALATGFCGSLTTFSTFGLETLTLRHAAGLGLSVLYAAASISLGLLCVYLGQRLGS